MVSCVQHVYALLSHRVKHINSSRQEAACGVTPGWLAAASRVCFMMASPHNAAVAGAVGRQPTAMHLQAKRHSVQHHSKTLHYITCSTQPGVVNPIQEPTKGSLRGKTPATHPTIMFVRLLLLQACPHVSGAAALYAASYKKLTNSWPSAAQTKAALMNTGTADNRYTVRCWSVFAAN
jgi:hypothetical protein